MGLFFCVASLLVTLAFTLRSLGLGVCSALTVGYLYGIVRANYLDTYSHFIFDSAVLGCYLGLLFRPPPAAALTRGRHVQKWVICIIGWAAVMFVLPFQHPLIQIVGLRGNAFLVPFILIGAWLTTSDMGKLVSWLAGLNLMAFGFALAEYWWGVPAFYPRNSVTTIIYNSNDVAGATAYRIPACFGTAHAYAGTMISTVPFLVGWLLKPNQGSWRRALFASGTAVAILGVFFTATRSGFISLAGLLLVTTLSRQVRGAAWLGWILLLISIGYVVSREERFQRFMTLTDTEMVLDRLEGSVNRTFLELLVSHPFGNGLGAGGTSIPYFLQGLIVDPIMMENEYSRILLELGIPGLLIWVSFVVWLLLRPIPPPSYPLQLGMRLMWYYLAGSFLLGMTGMGLMTSIPQTCLLFLMIGILASPPPTAAPARPEPAAGPAGRGLASLAAAQGTG